MAPTLTAFAFFFEGKKAELEAGGRTRPTTAEAVDLWRALSVEEREPWEEKAAAAQDAYLQECTKKALERLEAADAGVEEGDGEEDDGEQDDEGQEDGDGEDAGESSGFEGPPRLPFSRVKKVAQLGTSEVGLLGKEASFTMCKAAELFLEKVTWATLRVMQRDSRKTMLASHLTSALKLSSTPEAYQYFLEELQPAPPEPPEPPPKGSKKKSAAKGAGAAKAVASDKAAAPAKPAAAAKGKRKAADDNAAEAPAEASDAPPPAKRGPGRPRKNPVS